MTELLKEPKELLIDVEKSLRIADHLIYITYPLIKDSRLLKKIIEHFYEITNLIIKSILQHESMYKRIQISNNLSKDFEIFKEKCASRFNFSKEEIEIIKQLFILGEKHDKSSTEFIRKDKLVIMSNNLKTESIGLEELKKYLNALKIILNKTKAKINDKYI